MSKKTITLEQLLNSFMVKPKVATVEPGKIEPVMYDTHVDALIAVLKTKGIKGPMNHITLQTVVTHVNESRKLHAVKDIKESTGLGLKDAKDGIDTYIT